MDETRWVSAADGSRGKAAGFVFPRPARTQSQAKTRRDLVHHRGLSDDEADLAPPVQLQPAQALAAHEGAASVLHDRAHVQLPARAACAGAGAPASCPCVPRIRTSTPRLRPLAQQADHGAVGQPVVVDQELLAARPRSGGSAPRAR